jgi:hypothetical protein
VVNVARKKRDYNARDSHGNKKFCTVGVSFNELEFVAKKLGVDRDGPVQNHLTDLVMQALPAFMPRESGLLISRMSKPYSSKIRVDGPYARFLFFGLKKDGTPVEYDNNNPQGTSHWDRRMAAARGASIAGQVKAYARRVNKK